MLHVSAIAIHSPEMRKSVRWSQDSQRWNPWRDDSCGWSWCKTNDLGGTCCGRWKHPRTPGTPGMTEEIWFTCTVLKQSIHEYSISVPNKLMIFGTENLKNQGWKHGSYTKLSIRFENLLVDNWSKFCHFVTYLWMFRRCWKHSSGDTYIGSFSKTSVWKNYLIILIVYRIWLEDVARNWMIPARSI